MGRGALVGWSLAVLVLLSLVMGAWAHDAKVWLMDDFRDGYSAGADRVVSRGDQYQTCRRMAEGLYGGSGSYNESSTAFTAGCWRALGGGENDFWHVADYLGD